MGGREGTERVGREGLSVVVQNGRYPDLCDSRGAIR